MDIFVNQLYSILLNSVTNLHQVTLHTVIFTHNMAIIL